MDFRASQKMWLDLKHFIDGQQGKGLGHTPQNCRARECGCCTCIECICIKITKLDGKDRLIAQLEAEEICEALEDCSCDPPCEVEDE